VTEPQQRHVSSDALQEFVASAVPVAVPIPGEPKALLTLDGHEQTMELAVAWDGEAPPQIADHVHIRTGVVFRAAATWSTLTVQGVRFFEDAYPMLRSIADLVQLEGVTFGAAVERSLGNYHDLLSAEAHMPPLEEIGLFGELLVLEHLVTTLGSEAALSAWLGGGQGGEHDFDLPEGDVEVKTTTSEKRLHWIGSLTQLTATLNRPLWLLSVQLTGAGGEGPGAERLPTLVDRVEAAMAPAHQPAFRARLEQTTYRPQQPFGSYRLLRRRSTAACFRVEGGFPRLDESMLRAGGAITERIGTVSYQIDLDGLAAADTVPAALAGF
jgi:hypothetical protein